MKPKVTLLQCGTCGKPRGLRHECVTRLGSKRRPRRTKVQIRVTTGTCPHCHKPRGNPLTHTCTVKTDFKARLRAEAQREKAAKKRRKAAAKREAARQRKVAAKERQRQRARSRKPAPSRPRPSRPRHDYLACNDQDCAAYPCRVYRDGVANGRQIGHAEGYAEGYAEGMANCPLSHG